MTDFLAQELRPATTEAMATPSGTAATETAAAVSGCAAGTESMCERRLRRCRATVSAAARPRAIWAAAAGAKRASCHRVEEMELAAMVARADSETCDEDDCSQRTCA